MKYATFSYCQDEQLTVVRFWRAASPEQAIKRADVAQAECELLGTNGAFTADELRRLADELEAWSVAADRRAVVEDRRERLERRR